MNDGSKTVESRFLLAAIVCALLLIVNYFALVGTPWGCQFDHDAFLGRKMLGREIIKVAADPADSKSGKIDFFRAWYIGRTTPHCFAATVGRVGRSPHRK